MRKTTLLLGSLLLASAAFADDAGPYDGKWHTAFHRADGNSFTADIVLAGQTGTWTTSADRAYGNHRNPCIGQAMPLTVVSSTASELKFRVEGSKTIKGCNDFGVSVKPMDDKTLDGRFDGGGALKLERR